MKCPVCCTICNENTQICQICAWEFSIWVSDISDEERNRYNETFKIAQNNWQKFEQMRKKIQALEQNLSITLDQPKEQKPVKTESTKTSFLLDPFETEEEYRSRIQHYGPVKAGTAKLIKEKYDIKTGRFPIEIEKDKWINDNYLFDCHEPYIFAKRDIARDIYQKNQEYPIIVRLGVRNRTIFTESIQLDVDKIHFEIQNISKDIIPLKNTFIDPVTKMEFVYVRGGCFKMGDTSENANKKPVDDVNLYGFFMGKHPVTQGQWEIVMHNNPSHFQKGKNYPVENISWNDTQVFIQKLNNLSKGNTYRLPTEAEWEYAARSGGKNEKYAGGQNIENLAWYKNNSNVSTHEVGQKFPNTLGLHDLSGNVWEWCADFYQDSGLRVLRGGSWRSGGGFCRSVSRLLIESSSHYSYFGFRIVFSPKSEV